jgi:hypothetical protein
VENVGTVLLVVGGIALVIAVGAVFWFVEKKRREALISLANSNGWTIDERDDRWTTSFEGSPFNIGHNRQARHVMSGHHDGRPFVGFDYVYYTTEWDTDSNGNRRRKEVAHWYSVLGLEIGTQVPRLEVTPEGFFGRAIGKLFNNDIELESEEFNRAFTVSSPDRKFAYDVLHPRLMEYLLTVRTVAWRTSNGWLLTVENGKHSADEIMPQVQVLDTILDMIPDFVREQRGIAGTQEIS